MLRTSTHRQRGVSLVELMVGLTVGLIIVAAAASVYITAVRSGADTLRSAKLNMELRSAMDVMAAEIRRAGYYPNTADVIDNPYMKAATNLTSPSAGCFLFSYDANGNSNSSPPPAADNPDFFGFRRNSDDASISMRMGGDGPPAPLPSTAAGCTVSTDSWERITDPNSIVVDTLAFGVTYQCENSQTGAKSVDDVNEACAAGGAVYEAAVLLPNKSDLIEIRYVTITLEGHHKSDSLTKMKLSQSVRVRNDRIQTVP